MFENDSVNKIMVDVFSIINFIFQVYPPMMYICRLSSFDKPGVLEMSETPTIWERGWGRGACQKTPKNVNMVCEWLLMSRRGSFSDSF